MPIEITDEFKEPQGEFANYSAIPNNQEEALKTQKHVNIRSFVNEKLASQIRMLDIDRFTMSVMDGKELGLFSLPTRITVVNNEAWTFGTVGVQSDRNNWNGISVICDPAKSFVTTTQSVITQNG